MASFYVVATPIPHGVYEMRVVSNGNRVCCFKIGDTDNLVQRFATYRSMNPDVSMKGSCLNYTVPDSYTGVALRHHYRPMGRCQPFLWEH